MENKQSSWTTIEQSKKLIDIGINKNTASMSYITQPIIEGDGIKYLEGPKLSTSSYNDSIKIKSLLDNNICSLIEVTPCWTLSDLISIIPVNFTIYDNEGVCHDVFVKFWKTIIGNDCSIDFTYFDQYNDRYVCLYSEVKPFVDAFVDAIIWLSENNYIQNIDKNE